MIQGAAEKLYLGNIITLEDIKPFAKALTVVGNKIQYVGSLETARTLCDENTKIYDFGGRFIYPGFLDAHTHGLFAGYRAIGQANVSKIVPPDKDKYREVIKSFVANNPTKEVYMVAGWIEDGKTIFTSEFLDEICPDKPLMMNSAGGHSLLLNRTAMKHYGVTAEFAKKYGTDLVRVDANGEPTGYLCETPAVKIATTIPISLNEAKDFILNWQDFTFANGFTGVTDAGVEIVTPSALPAYVELEKENKLKLYTFGYTMVEDNTDNPKASALKAAELVKKCNSQHFNIIGLKVFLDGVLEAHTAWLVDDYNDQQGYHGNERFNDSTKMTELLIEASQLGLSVHAHSDGDGATKFFLDCIETALKITKNADQRNALAHLQFVRKEDIKRLADTNSIAVVPPLWTPALPGVYEIEIGNVGKQRAASQYPIKSFFDAGSDVVFHSDYPISPLFNGPVSIFCANLRGLPQENPTEGDVTESTVRGASEVITREQALLAMTKNVAYMWHQEHNLGSLATGKIANMTILDTDLLNAPIRDLLNTNVVATIVDGDIVYQA